MCFCNNKRSIVSVLFLLTLCLTRVTDSSPFKLVGQESFVIIAERRDNNNVTVAGEPDSGANGRIEKTIVEHQGETQELFDFPSEQEIEVADKNWPLRRPTDFDPIWKREPFESLKARLSKLSKETPRNVPSALAKFRSLIRKADSVWNSTLASPLIVGNISVTVDEFVKLTLNHLKGAHARAWSGWIRLLKQQVWELKSYNQLKVYLLLLDVIREDEANFSAILLNKDDFENDNQRRLTIQLVADLSKNCAAQNLETCLWSRHIEHFLFMIVYSERHFLTYQFTSKEIDSIFQWEESHHHLRDYKRSEKILERTLGFLRDLLEESFAAAKLAAQKLLEIIFLQAYLMLVFELQKKQSEKPVPLSLHTHNLTLSSPHSSSPLLNLDKTLVEQLLINSKSIWISDIVKPTLKFIRSSLSSSSSFSNSQDEDQYYSLSNFLSNHPKRSTTPESSTNFSTIEDEIVASVNFESLSAKWSHLVNQCMPAICDHARIIGLLKHAFNVEFGIDLNLLQEVRRMSTGDSLSSANPEEVKWFYYSMVESTLDNLVQSGLSSKRLTYN